MARTRKYSKTHKTGGSKSPAGTYSSGGRKSRGQARYLLMTDAKKEADKYMSQAEEEAKKAGKRSLWSSVGGILGGIAVPMMLGPGGWIAAAAMTAGGSYYGGRLGRQLAESGVGGDARRKDIKVDKFYDKKAEAANLEFKKFDKDIESNLRKQALVSGVTAGIAKSGVVSKIGDKVKGTFLPGETMAGQVGKFDIPLLSGGESAAGFDEFASNIGTDRAPGALREAVSGVVPEDIVQEQLVSLPGTAPKAADISFDMIESAKTSDTAFGSLSNQSLWKRYGRDLGKTFGRVTAESLLSQALKRDEEKRNIAPSINQDSLYNYYIS